MFATSLVVAPAATVSAAPVGGSCVTIGHDVSCTYSYLGVAQEFVVPAGVTSLTAELVGGTGGSSGGQAGGNPGVVNATFSVTPGSTLGIYVGGSASGSTAGWNGGGSGVNGSGGGGGATDIRLNGSGLSNRLLVAAGGGGAGASSRNGTGGAGGNASQAGGAATDVGGNHGGSAGNTTAGGLGGAAVAPPSADGWGPATPSVKDGTAGTDGTGGTFVSDATGAGAGGGGGGGGLFGGGSGAGGGHYVRAVNGLEFVDTAGSGGGGGANGIKIPALGLSVGTTTGAPHVFLRYTLPDVAPTLLFDPSSVNLTANAICVATLTGAPATVTGIPTPSVTYSPPLGISLGLGTIVVTGTASNGVSPNAISSFTATVRDTTPPTISNVPANITLSTTDPNGAVATYTTPTVQDNCGVTSINRTQGLASGSTFPVGTTIVEYTAKDAANNAAARSFTVTVNLVTPPTIGAIADVHVTAATGTCSATVPAPTVTTGGTPLPDVTFSPAMPGVFPVGSTGVTATATNGTPPDATTNFRVVVEDHQSPTLTNLPANITVPYTDSSGAVVTFGSPTVGDNCPGAFLSQTKGPSSGDVFPIGVTTVEFQASDGSNNTTTESFTVTVTGEAPTLAAIDNQVLWNDANVCSAVGFTPRVTVTGVPVPTVTFSPPMTTSFPVGSTTVTATASNGVSPDATRTFRVIVTDVQGPTLTMPANITVPATSAAGAVVTYAEPTANDNCEGPLTPTRTSGLASGSVFPIGTTTINYQVNGRDGLTSDFFTVTVTGTAPSIEPIANIVVPTAINTCSAVVPQPVPVVTGLPVPTVTFSPTWPASFTTGTTQFTATASNGVSPDATTSFVVTVEDHQPPRITVPRSIVVTATSAAGAVVVYGAISASDHCGAPTITRRAGPVSGSTFPIGTTTVTFRATDASGNFSEDSFTVTVNGAPPTIGSITGITVNADVNTCAAAGVAAPSTTTTGIPAPTVSFSPAMPGSFPVGTTTVTATATNGIAPDASTTFPVTVVDSQVPTIAGPSDITVFATSPGGATVTYAAPIASDNCPGVTFTRSVGPASGATFPIGDTVVTHVAKDAAGRTSTTSFRVHVAGAGEQISALITQVTGTGPGKALKNELVEAQRELARGDLRDACRELDSFVSLVKAQRGKKLTRQQADAFVAAAQQIIAVMNCRCLPPSRDRDRH